jgi:hypothetical protein
MVQAEDGRLAAVAEDVLEELRAAMARYGPMASAHEGYAVLLEELDELKSEVWKSPKRRDPAAMRAEAVQVAAMAMRFIYDLCDAES